MKNIGGYETLKGFKDSQAILGRNQVFEMLESD